MCESYKCLYCKDGLTASDNVVSVTRGTVHESCYIYYLRSRNAELEEELKTARYVNNSNNGLFVRLANFQTENTALRELCGDMNKLLGKLARNKQEPCRACDGSGCVLCDGTGMIYTPCEELTLYKKAESVLGTGKE